VIEVLLLGIMELPLRSMADLGREAVNDSANDPYPDYIKRKIYYAFGGDGMFIYVIFDIEQGMEEEALKNIEARALRFGATIGDLKFELRPLISFEEGFEIADTLES
jgi:hypothetical protein